MRTGTQGFSCILLEAIPGRGIGDSFSALGFVKYYADRKAPTF